MTQQYLFEINNGFENRSVKDVTFQGKLDLPIHRWYRLTPSFSPRLADDIADYFSLGGSDLVLDPFSGVGTVPVSMKYRGVPAWSVELNPYLYFVSTVKTRTYNDLYDIENMFADFVRGYRREARKLPADSSADAYLREHEQDLPRIHKPGRWWSEGNLMQLVCLRRLVLGYQAERTLHDLLRMAVLAILVPVSNAKHNHVSLTFAGIPRPTLDIPGILERKMLEILDDLRRVAPLPYAEVQVFNGNSKSLQEVLPRNRKVSAVITSPPYPNRFSYARETRPHMFFFNFIEDAKAVGRLETVAIGGTWGAATSVLSKGIEPKNAVVRKVLSSHLKDVEEHGGLMAAYVTKYFNDIYDHAGQIAKVASRNCRLAYVIGNSKFYGNPLDSDEMLAEIFGHFGFQLERIDRMRKRQSKAGLYEAVVFMKR